MLTGMRMKNFKSWEDTGDLRLAPITGFFGTNSSGKTALLQMLESSCNNYYYNPSPLNPLSHVNGERGLEPLLPAWVGEGGRELRGKKCNKLCYTYSLIAHEANSGVKRPAYGTVFRGR